MLTYDLKVGYSCNNKCKHCVIDDSKDRLIEQKTAINLTTQECLQQIDDTFNKGIKNIVLTGGEITIRKDFDKIIEQCVKYYLDITIQTNGRRLADDFIIKSIKDVNHIRFIVALHGDSPTTHDKITQVQGSFEETCTGIKRMCEMNKLVILKIVISKINQKELANIVKIGAALGVKYMCFAFPHGHGAARKNFDDIIPTYTDIQPYLKELIKVAREYSVNIEFEAIPYCIIPYAMQLVGELKYYEGDTLCTHVKEETFQWSEVRHAIKRKGPKCIDCDMNQFCEGVWEEYEAAFGTSELTPIKFPSNSREHLIKSIEASIKYRS